VIFRYGGDAKRGIPGVPRSEATQEAPQAARYAAEKLEEKRQRKLEAARKKHLSRKPLAANEKVINITEEEL